jgi:hypothetical protein
MLVIEFKQKLRLYFYKSHQGPQILETGLRVSLKNWDGGSTSYEVVVSQNK